MPVIPSNATFRALADQTRRDILKMLRAGPRTSGEIASRFDSSWPTVSRHLGVLKEAFSLAKGGYAICERSKADYEKDGRRFGVEFDKKVPKWKREQKRKGYGRTYWRLQLHN